MSSREEGEGGGGRGERGGQGVKAAGGMANARASSAADHFYLDPARGLVFSHHEFVRVIQRSLLDQGYSGYNQDSGQTPISSTFLHTVP